MSDTRQQHMRRIRIKAPAALAFLWVSSYFYRGTQISKAASLSQTSSTLPAWLEGLWNRNDVYVMTEDQAGDANDGLTPTDSWPNILRYPFLTRASATYPGPNGTKAFPNGVKVIVFLPGDYSMRKMHAGRTTEWYPHWDKAVGPNAPTAENPLIVVYADAYKSYSGMDTHPKLRSENQQADLAVLKFDNMVGVYLHGLRSIAPVSGVDYAGTTDGKIYGCWIETALGAGVTCRFGAHRNVVSYNFIKRPYPWSSKNDWPGINVKDGPNEDNIFEHNIVLNYADSFQGAMRSHLYRQDPLDINITAGGSGYVVGDPLVFGEGTTTTVYRHAVGIVSAVALGGAITAVETVDQGAYEGGFPSVTVTSDAGTGAILTCTALAGPVIIFGDNFLAPDIWEQGWTENTGYSGIAGTILRDNWFGCTDEVKVSNVYNIIHGVENCIDLKTGGTVQKPVLIYNNYLFGLRANGSSPSACFTFHDVCSYVNIYNNTICDMSSVFNLNTQVYRDRAPNDGGSTGGTAYPAWEGFTTIDFHDNAISDIHNFATTESFLAMQGRIFYSGNSLTYRNNWHSYCDYLAEMVVNPQAPSFVFAGNWLPSTTDLGPYTGSLPPGWRVYTPGINTGTVFTIPFTTNTITVNRTEARNFIPMILTEKKG